MRFLTQLVAPPVTAGAVGAVRSICAVLPAPAAAGDQAEELPALSSARNWTRVEPSAVIPMLAPGAWAVQVTPPLVDVRYW